MLHSAGAAHSERSSAYFANSNGIFVGDEVRILGVPVGKIETIEPQPNRVKITFWYDAKYQVPADAKAVILSPAIVTARVIQLTPAYTGGPQMHDRRSDPRGAHRGPGRMGRLAGATRTAHRDCCSRPNRAGSARWGRSCTPPRDNLRGQGANIRDTIIKLSQAVSALGDHSEDLFSTLKNLSVLVSALQDSGDLMRQLNGNLASVTGLLTDDPNEVGDAVVGLDAVVGDVRSFVADNRETLGTTADKLASVSPALDRQSRRHQAGLHIAPNELQNLMNIYQPAQATLGGAFAFNNFAEPDHVPVRRHPGGVSTGCRTVGQAVRPVPGADRQEPPVQLPPARREPHRRGHRPTERGDLQRRLAATGLRAAAAGQFACGAGVPPLPAEAHADRSGGRPARHDDAGQGGS